VCNKSTQQSKPRLSSLIHVTVCFDRNITNTTLNVHPFFIRNQYGVHWASSLSYLHLISCYGLNAINEALITLNLTPNNYIGVQFNQADAEKIFMFSLHNVSHTVRQLVALANMQIKVIWLTYAFIQLMTLPLSVLNFTKPNSSCVELIYYCIAV
jgi:hypothetical protein